MPPASAEGLAARQVLYQTGVTLPPGRFSLKVVVRENTTGQMGTFETPIVVPELKNAPVQGELGRAEHAAAERGRAARPRARWFATASSSSPTSPTSSAAIRSCISTTRCTSPAPRTALPQLRTSLAFYRGKVKVFETPVVERTADRRRGSPRGDLPVRGAGRQLQARPLHLPGQHHRRGGREVRVPAARALRAVSLQGQLGYSPNIDTPPSQRS